MTDYGINAVILRGYRQGAWTSNLRVPGIQLVRHGRGGRTTVGLSPLCPRKPTKCGVAVIDAKGLRAAKIYPQRMRMRMVN